MRWNISRKLIVILVIVAIAPITLFGILAIWTSRETTYQSVAEGNLNVAIRAAEQIELYVANSLSILEALAQNLGKTDLADWQRQRIITNYVINFDEFEEIYLTDLLGKELATSELGVDLKDRSEMTAVQQALSGQTYRSQVFISDNLVPSIQIAIPVQFLNKIEGALLGEVNLISMWNLVDSIQIGTEGRALVISDDGLLIAHGAPEKKDLVLKQQKMAHLPIVSSALTGKKQSLIYVDDDGIKKIGVSVPVPSLGWALIIEQPTREAFAAANQMILQLSILIVIFLILAVALGMFTGRQQIVSPIRELTRVTKKISDGILTEKVKILTKDEFHDLGSAFNQMTEKLIQFQEEIRRNERSAMFGRIASGLVHDLRHPIRNIENSAKLLLRDPGDTKHVKVFEKTVKREFENINRFLDDLRDLTHPIPLKPIRMNLHHTLSELVEIFGVDPRCRIVEEDPVPVIDNNGKTTRIIKDFGNSPIKVMADRFAIERVFKNLMTNAIQAMPEGGQLLIRTLVTNDKKSVLILFSDTGCGIPPERLKDIFTDFVTTKGKGLGLGLAITKRIIHDLNGTIQVESRLKQGTDFTITLPAI